MGFQDWFVDSGTFAAGSAAVGQAFEGRHYYRSMRLDKEGFDVLVQSRVEDIPDIHPYLLGNLSELGKGPSSKPLEHITI